MEQTEVVDERQAMQLATVPAQTPLSHIPFILL